MFSRLKTRSRFMKIRGRSQIASAFCTLTLQMITLEIVKFNVELSYDKLKVYSLGNTPSSRAKRDVLCFNYFSLLSVTRAIC